MKKTVTMPEGEEKQFKLLPENTYKFQVTDLVEENDDYVVIKCEVVEADNIGSTILYRVALNGDFLWLTKLFLKCIGEPHNGEISIDTDSWFGRQFWGEVKHTQSKDGKTYANIKKLIYKDEPIIPRTVSDPKDIQWEN